MRTLKVLNGDLVLNENGEFMMVEGLEEVAQGVKMNLAIRKGEFKLEEFIGLDTGFLGEKRISQEDLTESVLSALQIMTDQNIIEGAEEIRMGEKNRQTDIDLRLLLTDGTSIDLTGGEKVGA